MEMKRIYHHYTKWEEVEAGMWKKYNSYIEEQFFIKAVEFTGNVELYGEWMLRVIDAWPISCEQNLSCGGMNRQAWIGHAACCLAIKCPEHITRLAWWQLPKEIQDAANAKADYAIKIWEQRHEN